MVRLLGAKVSPRIAISWVVEVAEGDGDGAGLGEGRGDGVGEGRGDGVGDGLADGLGEAAGEREAAGFGTATATAERRGAAAVGDVTTGGPP
jgi:hypothetical protein